MVARLHAAGRAVGAGAVRLHAGRRSRHAVHERLLHVAAEPDGLDGLRAGMAGRGRTCGADAVRLLRSRRADAGGLGRGQRREYAQLFRRAARGGAGRVRKFLLCRAGPRGPRAADEHLRRPLLPRGHRRPHDAVRGQHGRGARRDGKRGDRARAGGRTAVRRALHREFFVRPERAGTGEPRRAVDDRARALVVFGLDALQREIFRDRYLLESDGFIRRYVFTVCAGRDRRAGGVRTAFLAGL